MESYPIYYDAEFTGLYQYAALISIGFVTKDNEYFYAEFNDYNCDQCDDWVKANVLKYCNLPFKYYNKLESSDDVYSLTMSNVTHKIKTELIAWLKTIHHKYKMPVQIYGDCYAYDWMLFNDLVCKNGAAINLPSYINYIPMDLCTTMQLNNIDPDISREEFVKDVDLKISSTIPSQIKNEKHNSLYDAYVIKACYDKILNK